MRSHAFLLQSVTRPFRVLLSLSALLLLVTVTPVQAQHAHGSGHADMHGGQPAPQAPAGEPTPSPYAGQESRALKALSPQEVSGLMNGEGMGLAKVAELNRYPGPRHVLDLAAELALDPTQQAETRRIFERMQARAQAVGHSLLRAEEALEAAFSGGTIDTERLTTLTAEIGRLQGELRNVHLRAHLEMKDLLRAEQVAAYDRLRGYTAR